MEKNEVIKMQIHKIAKILNNFGKKTDNLSLLTGSTGISLFHFYYSRIFQDGISNDNAYDIIEKVFSVVENNFTDYTFAFGFAGIGWTIEFLEQNNFLETNTDEVLYELDEYLYKIMIRELRNNNYDYLRGASGIALYFTKRKKSGKIQKYLADYVNILDEIAIKEREITKWVSETNTGEDKTEKVYNPSMSHGMASLISILSKIHKLGIKSIKTEKLITGAIKYLFRIMQDTEKHYSFFPNSTSVNSIQNSTSRLAWCNGDLGISIAIWNASQIIKNKEWENKALEILHYSTKRTNLEKNRVVDAGLCHGAAGIAHIFNRMFINTKDKIFKDTANYWYAETLKMVNHKESLSGFKAWHTKKYGGWIEEFGFLEGIAGVGLSLMTTISDIEPTWDEILLIS